MAALSIAFFTTMMALLSATCAVWSALSARGAHRSATSSRRVRELEVEVTDLRALYERLFDSHKRLRSRERMEEIRLDRSGAPMASSPSSSSPKPDEAQVRALVERGKKRGLTRRETMRKLLNLPASPLDFVRETIKRATGG